MSYFFPYLNLQSAGPRALALVMLLGMWTCKNVNYNGAPVEPDKNDVPAHELPGDFSRSQPDALPGASSPASANAAARIVCTTTPGSAKRTAALDVIEKYQPGGQPWNAERAATSPAACVDALRLAAVYVNLLSGVPAGTILGQALQETGYCKSDLALEALNFHGMKAHVDVSSFTYWEGEKYRKSSTESTTGEGNDQVSDFMKFSHADYGLLSLAERLLIPSLPYTKCFSLRATAETFMECIGKSWAVHTEYTQAVLALRATYKLAECELRKDEWRLRGKWVGK